MKILADEGIDAPIVRLLRNNGHSVDYVAEMLPGIVDEEVLSLARSTGATLLTQDKDFGDLIFRQRLLTSSVILIRLAGADPNERAEIVARVLEEHAAEVLRSFTVISPRTVRFRPI